MFLSVIFFLIFSFLLPFYSRSFGDTIIVKQNVSQNMPNMPNILKQKKENQSSVAGRVDPSYDKKSNHFAFFFNFENIFYLKDFQNWFYLIHSKKRRS